MITGSGRSSVAFFLQAHKVLARKSETMILQAHGQLSCQHREPGFISANVTISKDFTQFPVFRKLPEHVQENAP
jgi:hypothetical protein